jgi:uncharacterized protein YuzB (UPF0349 family)
MASFSFAQFQSKEKSKMIDKGCLSLLAFIAASLFVGVAVDLVFGDNNNALAESLMFIGISILIASGWIANALSEETETNEEQEDELEQNPTI